LIYLKFHLEAREDIQVFYEGFADSYDEMVNWESRIEFERKHFDRLFKYYGIQRVLDAACGTGRHCILFAELGYRVVGIDNNDAMLELAKQNIKESGVKGIKLHKGDLLNIRDVVKSRFDSVLCLGNSLPHITDDEQIVATLGQFREALKPSGLLLLQMVHFDYYLDSAESAVAVNEGVRKGRPVTFRRHYEFKGTKVIFHVSIYDGNSRDLLETYSTPLNAVRRELLENFLEKAGFTGVQFFKDVSLKPLTQEAKSLICFAFRPRG
jgi:ubiquinone/menaquinone biosynthesis C-methylase UbiE